MATSPVIKLTCGTRTLNLGSGRYRVDDDFVPPPYAMTPLIASGTSANKGGGTLVDTKPNDRAWAFGVHISGSSDAEVRRAIADLQMFLSLAGNESTPLYLEHKQNSDTPEPLWGNYGANIKYEILTGTARVSDLWAVSDLRARGLPACQVNLLIKPHAVGLRQRLGSAMGRIVEDVYGAADGVSKGLHISPSITNKMTNPVFGASTWNTGWTADASLTASQNTDTRFVLPGAVNSAKLFARSTGQEFYQSINVGNTNSHTFVAIICLPDLGTPSSSDCELFYSTTLTTTFVSLGNGFWRATATAAGINAATNTGIQIKNGRGGYLCYYGCIEGNNGINYQPIWGDHLGCAWSGTAHGSTSTSTAGRWRQAVAADTFDYQQGALRIVWTPPMIYSSFASANYYLFDAGSFIVFFDATNDVFTFYDGTNSASIATTFAADTPIVIHCVWGPSGKLIYINGVSATNTYTPPAAASYFYLGSSSTPSLWAGGVFGDLTVWGVALTATQIANDYANVAQLTADNQRVGCVPWLWTKDGDDVVDNCDDSTRDNWAVCGGVPGSAESNTEIDITPSSTSVTGYWLMSSAVDVNDFAYPNTGTETGVWYGELQGTVDANASGGQYESRAVTTDPDYATITVSKAKLAQGKINFFVRMKDSATSRTFYFAPWYSYGSGTRVFYPSNSAKSIDTSYRWFFVGQMSFSQPEGIDEKDMTAVVGIQASSGGGGVTVHSDYMMIATGPTLRIICTASAGFAKLVVRNGRVESRTSGGAMFSLLNSSGEFPSFAPDKLNFVWFVTSADGEAHVITDTATFNSVYVTPRYQLL